MDLACSAENTTLTLQFDTHVIEYWALHEVYLLKFGSAIQQKGVVLEGFLIVVCLITVTTIPNEDEKAQA